MSNSYVVRFGQAAAWTLEYQDGVGLAQVTFEPDLDSLEQQDQPQQVILNPGVIVVNEQGREQMSPDSQRNELVMQRVRQYLESIGYRVDEYKP